MVQSEQEQDPEVMHKTALHSLRDRLYWWKAEEGCQAIESRNRPKAKVLMRGWRDETRPFLERWLAPAVVNHCPVPTEYRGVPVPMIRNDTH